MKNINLTSISAFDLKTNDWQIALLQIYENLYLTECQKVKRLKHVKVLGEMGEWKYKRGLPDGMSTFSKSIKPFLEFLHERRCRKAPVPNTDQSR